MYSERRVYVEVRGHGPLAPPEVHHAERRVALRGQRLRTRAPLARRTSDHNTKHYIHNITHVRRQHEAASPSRQRAAQTQEKFELDYLRTKSKCELFPRPRRPVFYCASFAFAFIIACRLTPTSLTLPIILHCIRIMWGNFNRSLSLKLLSTRRSRPTCAILLHEIIIIIQQYFWDDLFLNKNNIMIKNHKLLSNYM